MSFIWAISIRTSSLLFIARCNSVTNSCDTPQVPIAHDVRADGTGRLKLIVKHMKSDIHSAAKKKEQLNIQWKKGSDKHPWLNVLKAHNASVVTFLMQLASLAFHVYNDSLYETLSAYSWPAWSLTTMAASKVIAVLHDERPDVKLNTFQPAVQDLHYRDPVYYCQMLDCVHSVELKRTTELLGKCVVFSIQIDGSVNKQVEICQRKACLPWQQFASNILGY